jgi:photosystem II stability/assembly factor-like uncharacterized protein
LAARVGKTGGFALLVVFVFAVLLVSSELLSTEFAPPPEANAVNPYPGLWPDWTTAASYVPSPTRWTSLGPNAGAIDLVVPDPSAPGTIFAGGRFAGIYRSSDGGSTWVQAENGMGQYYVTSIWVDSAEAGRVLAASGGYLYGSQDEGGNWDVVGACQGNSTTLGGDPAVPPQVYLGCGGGLLSSGDAGKSWAAVASMPPLVSVSSISVSGTSIYVLGAGENQSYAVDYSADGGIHWTSRPTDWAVGLGTFRPSIAVSPDNSSVVLVNAPTGIMWSGDAGMNWTMPVKDSYGVTGGFVGFDPLNGTAYAGRVLLYRSDDSGRIFSPVGSWGENCLTSPAPIYHADVGSVAFLKGGREVLMGTDGGVELSDDYGSNWTCEPNGMTNGLTYDVGVDPFDPSHLVVTRQDYYPAQSYDYGRTWTNVPGVESEWGSVDFDPVHRGVVYIAAGGGVWKSTDSGHTFHLSSSGLPTVPFPSSPRLDLDQGHPSNLWLSVSSLGLFRSTDGAKSWTKVTTFSYALEADARGEVAYAVATKAGIGGVWKSIDGGLSWTAVDLSQQEQYYEVKIDPFNASVVYVIGNELHVSFDGGATFRSVPMPQDLLSPELGSFGPSPYTLFVQRIGNLSRIILAAAKYGTQVNVYQSFDDGETWVPITGNLNSTMVTGISENPSYPLQLYISTFGQGTLREGVEAPLTLAYSLNGTGSAYTLPKLTYVYQSKTHTEVLTPGPRTVLVDWGSVWAVSKPVSMSSTGGEWVTDSPTIAVAVAPVSVNYTFTFVQSQLDQ